jgi:hypothetical protein
LSPQTVSGSSAPAPGASHSARWHMKLSAVAPCQCHSPAVV